MSSDFLALHQQFQDKQKELTMIGSQMREWAVGCQVHISRRRIMEKLSCLREKVRSIKSDFQQMRCDIEVYKEMPASFSNLVEQMPKVYEEIWERREEQLVRTLQVKEKQCKLLWKRLQEQHSSDPKAPQQDPSAIQSKQHQQALQWKQTEEALQVGGQLQERDDLDEYIKDMEIIIKDCPSDRIHEIHEIGSEDGESPRIRRVMKDRSLERCSFPKNSLYFTRNQTLRERPGSRDNMLSDRSKQDRKKVRATGQNLQVSEEKRKFWKDLSKQIDRTKSYCNQNKENNSQFQSCNRLLTTESQIFGSKMNDFRKMLFSRNRNVRPL